MFALLINGRNSVPCRQRDNFVALCPATREEQMSPTVVHRSSKMTNEGVAFVAISILIGIIFNPSTFGITAGIVMLLIVAFEYFNGPIGA
jgi:hypothetical protein